MGQVQTAGSGGPSRLNPLLYQQGLDGSGDSFQPALRSDPLDSPIHVAPRVPLVVDSCQYAPTTIHLFDGVPLYFLVDEYALHDAVLYGFSTRHQLATHLRTPKSGNVTKQARKRHQFSRPTKDSNPKSYFYERTSYGGSVLALDVGYGYRYLGSWAHLITSVQASSLGWGTVLYEHAGYRGLSMHVKTGQQISDLGLYGWESRTASIAVYW